MVREENLKLMTKIAMYEKHQGKIEIPMHEYYKKDYVRIHTLKAMISATVAFLAMAVLFLVYKLDYILANVLKMDYKKIGIGIAVVYGIWILAYWLIARIIYANRYENSRSNIIIYNHNLKKLQEEANKKVVSVERGVGIIDDFIEF